MSTAREEEIRFRLRAVVGELHSCSSIVGPDTQAGVIFRLAADACTAAANGQRALSRALMGSAARMILGIRNEVPLPSMARGFGE
jgi:hypothetical protein